VWRQTGNCPSVAVCPRGRLVGPGVIGAAHGVPSIARRPTGYGDRPGRGRRRVPLASRGGGGDANGSLAPTHARLRELNLHRSVALAGLPHHATSDVSENLGAASPPCSFREGGDIATTYRAPCQQRQAAAIVTPKPTDPGSIGGTSVNWWGRDLSTVRPLPCYRDKWGVACQATD
jgi:hypothetical protein